MSDTDLGSGDDLDRVLLAVRPVAAPTPDVLARHRAGLRDALEHTDDQHTPAWRSRRGLVAVALAAVAAVGATVLALRPGGDRTEITAGPGEPNPQDAGPVLSSLACEGRPLPFSVPIADGYGPPVLGSAPGAAGADVPGQLVAHWVSPGTAIEVRWPADVSERVLDQLGQTREDMDAHLANGLSPSSYTDADLSADVIDAADGSVDGGGYGFRSEPELDGTYTLGVTRYERVSESTSDRGTDLRPVWGSGMCSTVQLTVRALDGRADVRDEAEVLYRALVAEGGPLVPTREHPPLVVSRADASSLEPPSECHVPAGVDQDPIRSEAVAGPGPFPTADEALEAYLATQVTTNEEGPFGPESWRTAPEGGYTALTLPDGRIAYRWPASDPAVVGYYVAEQGPGGWSITRTEGPSC